MSALLAQLRQLDVVGLLVSLLDILIVAFFIYRVLLLIRGTRAAYMLTGLLAVAGIFFAANQLTLTTLSWLLDHLINYFIIIIIIVFQADIRRGLSRMGRKMFAPSRSTEDLAVIEEVVQACEQLAKNHVGALIVFEREADLEEFVDPGTSLDARVSRALLYNIFVPAPDNPLHDGAVVIKDKSVQQAGVILPLSRNPSLDKDLGTRHRAGVGITEETDAVAVVVSEQRGSISLCTGGLLHMGLGGPSLRRELLALMATGERSRWGWLDRAMRRWEEAIAGTKSMAHRTRKSGEGRSGATKSGERRPPTTRISTDAVPPVREPTGPHAVVGSKPEP
jgi:diadenylate cyclase